MIGVIGGGARVRRGAGGLRRTGRLGDLELEAVGLRRGDALVAVEDLEPGAGGPHFEGAIERRRSVKTHGDRSAETPRQQAGDVAAVAGSMSSSADSMPSESSAPIRRTSTASSGKRWIPASSTWIASGFAPAVRSWSAVAAYWPTGTRSGQRCASEFKWASAPAPSPLRASASSFASASPQVVTSSGSAARPASAASIAAA